MTDRIYKILPRELWELAETDGVFRGAAIDHEDGYIHFSTANQVAETASKHFASQTDLVLVIADSRQLAGKLKWEISRGGALFPHLYGDLEMGAVVSVRDMPMGDDGQHVISLIET